MQSEKCDEEHSLPKATIEKVIQELVPPKYNISKKAREVIRQLSQTFLNTVALEANKACEEDKKKTMSHDHVYKALKTFNFEDYVLKCTEAVTEYEDYSKKKPSKQNKFRESGLTEDELYEKQKELFSAARKETEAEYEIENEETKE